MNFSHAQNKEIINQQNNQGMNQNPIGLQSPYINNGDYNNSLGNYRVNGMAQNNGTIQQNNRDNNCCRSICFGFCLGICFFVLGYVIFTTIINANLRNKK